MRVWCQTRVVRTKRVSCPAFRRPFVPPPSDKYLTHRQLWYGGEEHPAEKKAVIVVPVSKLPLTQPSAVHKFKLIAGTRWSREYPKDSGFSSHELESLGEQGFIKISCEDMPDHGLNLKWCSDVLDRMVKESNASLPRWYLRAVTHMVWPMH